MKEKTCITCETTYTPTSRAQLYCTECKVLRAEEIRLRKKKYAELKRREKGCKVGQGALGADKHPNYKHGLYVSQTQTRRILESRKNCERCGKYLLGLTQWEWCTHHIDHNHANHAESNLELLCKRCHQIEHKCYNNLNV